ncbi:hypothetical protein ACS22S_27280, partial [Klebsiella pneumoniae]
IRNADLAWSAEGPIGLHDVRIREDRIKAIGAHLPALPGEPVLDAAGGAFLPGLNDHHLHLVALAAALDSVRCGPPDIHEAEALAERLRCA